jgi:hypothetical protein
MIELVESSNISKKKYKEHILDPIIEQEEEFDKQKY